MMRCQIMIVLLLMLSLHVLPAIAAPITYTYDERDRLHVVTLENSQTITYEYDKVGNIISRTVSQPNNTGSGPFTISVTPSGCGTVTPAVPPSLTKGSSQTFNFQASTGSYLTDVKIDGVSIGIVSSYTFSNITANHTLSVTFAIPDGNADNIGNVDISDALITLKATVGLIVNGL